ncbi:hypothetical protein GCM10010219_41350 [Streptomyces netropsis]|nr:hypothetical protein GCM10010219_41350 [Streptomyces netropsis]
MAVETKECQIIGSGMGRWASVWIVADAVATQSQTMLGSVMEETLLLSADAGPGPTASANTARPVTTVLAAARGKENDVEPLWCMARSLAYRHDTHAGSRRTLTGAEPERDPVGGEHAPAADLNGSVSSDSARMEPSSVSADVVRKGER